MKCTLFILVFFFSACNIFSPQFDEVVYVGDHGDYNTYLDVSMLFRSDKSVVIKKRLNLRLFVANSEKEDSIIIQTATLDDTVFKKIFDIDINKIQQTTVHVEDMFAQSMTFSKNKKILRNINSYRFHFPKVEKMAYIDSPSVFKNLQTVKHPNPLYYIRYFFVLNDSTKERYCITNSDTFLLANYLCEGTPKDTVITKGHTISLTAHFPKTLIHNKLQTLKNVVTTDGRYYCFETEEGDFMTIDIGFNFLTYTMKDSCEEWLAGKNPK